MTIYFNDDDQVEQGTSMSQELLVFKRIFQMIVQPAMDPDFVHVAVEATDRCQIPCLLVKLPDEIRP